MNTMPNKQKSLKVSKETTNVPLLWSTLSGTELPGTKLQCLILEKTNKYLFLADLELGTSIEFNLKRFCKEMYKEYPDHRYILRNEISNWDEIVHDGDKFVSVERYVRPPIEACKEGKLKSKLIE